VEDHIEKHSFIHKQTSLDVYFQVGERRRGDLVEGEHHDEPFISVRKRIHQANISTARRYNSRKKKELGKGREGKERVETKKEELGLGLGLDVDLHISQLEKEGDVSTIEMKQNH